jgi:hypothetical protein
MWCDKEDLSTSKKGGIEWRMKMKEAGRKLNIPGKEVFVEHCFQKSDKRQLGQSLYVEREIETKLALFIEGPRPQAILQIRKLFNFYIQRSNNFRIKNKIYCREAISSP